MLTTIRLVTLFTLVVAPHGVAGDVYELKGGGEVVGELVERKDADFFVKTSDGVQVIIARDQLERILPQTQDALEYARRGRGAPDTADSHRQLAAWCAERGRKADAEHHLQRLIALDPADEDARSALGYQRVGRRWLTRDEIMVERGMQLFEGKYRTPQDIAVRQRHKNQEAVEIDWFAKLRMWRGWLQNRRPDRVAEAQQQIAAVNDPQATPALVKLLDNEQEPWIFDLLLEAVARMEHPLATQTLVAYSLDHDDAEIRGKCLDYLMGSGKPVIILPYVQALKSKDNVIVNRAGTALGKIGDPAAMSPLIDALITRHKYEIQPGQPGQIGAAFDPSGGSGGFSFGGNGPKIIEKDHENLGVQRALVRITGNQDLDFNEQAWRRWYVDRQMREHINSRRDE